MSMSCADLPASYVADAKAHGEEAKGMSWLRRANVPDHKGGAGLLLGEKEAWWDAPRLQPPPDVGKKEGKIKRGWRRMSGIFSWS